MHLAVAPDVTRIVRLGAIRFDAFTLVAAEPRLDAPLADVEARVRRDPPEERVQVRAMYKRVGLDPTKTRPSSEALLRRVRRGDPLPRINTLVDVCNWCSLELQVPYGVYDAARIAGDVELRIGREGEEYAGIRKDTVHLAGRLTLSDDRGPFGNPSSDSARTLVTPETTSALVAIFAPRELGEEWVAQALTTTAVRIAEFAGGREAERWVG